MPRIVAILILIIIISPAKSIADPYENLAPRISFMESDSDEFTIDRIQEPGILELFQPMAGTQFSWGYTGPKDYWLSFEVGGNDTPGWKAIEFNNPRIGEAILYYPDHDGDYQAYTLGTRHPFWERQIGGLTPAFPVRLTSDHIARCFVRIRHFGSLRFEVRLWDLNVHNRYANRTLAFYMLLSGALITLAAYNLCVYIHLRQCSYLWLATFLVALNSNLMATSGTANMLLWPQPSWLSFHSMTITSLLSLCTGIGFVTYYLRSAPGSKVLNRIAIIAALIALTGMIGTFLHFPSAFYLIITGGILAALVSCALSISAIIAKQPFALAFMGCWGMLFLGVIITCLMGPGLIPSTSLTENFIFLATLPAAVGWSFSLTSQIKAQERVQRERLEQKVADRTTALKQAVEEVKTLHGLLPICCSCKKIRDDDGYWQHVETYLHTHMSTDFSHGLCPDCATDLYPNYFPETPTEQTGETNDDEE